MSVFFAVLSIGLVTGFALSISGAGGTIIALPLLMLALNIPLQNIAPMVLLAITLSAGLGTWLAWRQGLVRYKSAMLMASFGIVSAPLGAIATHYLPQRGLHLLLASIMVYIAFKMWFASNTEADNQAGQLSEAPACMLNPATSKLFWTASCTKRLSLTGVLAGFLSGLLGVGGGFVIVPALATVSNFSAATISATSLMVISLVSLSSFISHLYQMQALHQSLDWMLTVPFVVSALACMLITNQFKHLLTPKVRQRGFAIMCLIASAQLLFHTFSH